MGYYDKKGWQPGEMWYNLYKRITTGKTKKERKAKAEIEKEKAGEKSTLEERKINVEWETISPNIVRRFKVTAAFKEDIFSEIEGSIRKNSGHLISGRLKKDDEGRLTGFFVIEIEKKENFTDILKNIRSIPEILNVKSI